MLTGDFAGPYAGAVLRFEIAFPDSYPDDPPLVTFSSDIFHPLVVPLTTYTFAASVVDASSTISAADQDRLPPGAFSLRHGFPHWFRARDSTTGDQIDTVKSARRDDENESKPGVSANDHMKTSEDVRVPSQAEDRKDLMLKMLSYIKKAFENDALLDEMPLEAAGDPSAWHAWRAYRGLGKADGPKSPAPAAQDGVPASPKRPSEWKWDGVWESRVTNGIETSVSEATLFGSASGGRAGQASVDTTKSDVRQAMVTNSNRQIRFVKVDVERFEELRKDILTYDKPVST